MTSIRGILPMPPLRAVVSGGADELLSSNVVCDGVERDPATRRQTADRLHEPTPSRNAGVVFRRGGFASLSEALDYAAQGDTGLNFFDGRGRLLAALHYSLLRDEALTFARRLVGAGIERGNRLLLVADTWPGFCVAFFGAQYAGVIPVPVSLPVGLGAKAGYIDQLKRQIAAAGAVGIVAPDDLAEFVRTAAAGTTARLAGSMRDFDRISETEQPLCPLGAGEACYVQFSSGSTRTPQGIDIRQDQLMANIDGSLAAQEVCDRDAGVSWLPLYHDMGLIGFVLAPMCAQRSVDLLAPHEFARRPMQWLSLISRRQASITYSPSFGYDLVVRRAQRQAFDGLDLSCLRLAGIGAEMIQPAVLRRFADAFASAGFDHRAFMASYGMAELCVGLSFSKPMGGIVVDSFTDSATGRTRDFVVCGRVMAGHRVEIRDDAGRAIGDRQVGRLFAHGPSVMQGYFNPASLDAGPVCDGWLDTGDLGYSLAGELVITGRAKDLIIVNGRNIWPQDIEWAVEALPQRRPGDACAFSIAANENESLVVLVQGRPNDEKARILLEGEVRQAIKELVGIDGKVILIPRQPGLPTTSSGKLSRSAARDLYLAGGYGS